VFCLKMEKAKGDPKRSRENGKAKLKGKRKGEADFLAIIEAYVETSRKDVKRR